MKSESTEKNLLVLQATLLNTLEQLLDLKETFVETKEQIWDAIKIIGINEKEYLSVEEFALLLNLKPSTVYKKSHEGKFTVHKLEENGKLSYFKRSEIKQILEANKTLSNKEIERQALDYTFKNRKK